MNKDGTYGALPDEAVQAAWNREDNDRSILIYSLRRDGWRKGHPFLVNDVTIRVEKYNGSISDIEPIAQAILSSLTAALPFLQGVKVKELAWSSEPPYSVARVPKLHLVYSTECVWDEGKFLYCILSGTHINQQFETHEAAKAAAQADYAARILSAIEVSAPDPSPRAQALEEGDLLNRAALIVEGRCTAVNSEFIQKLSKRNAPEIASLIAEHDIKLGAAIRALSQPVAEQSAAALDVLAERRRQIEVEGWTPGHDDRHGDFSLARAAVTYATGASINDADRAVLDQFGNSGATALLKSIWPKNWAWSWFKPTNRRSDLVKAGALIIAEIERLDRATPPEASK